MERYNTGGLQQDYCGRWEALLSSRFTEFQVLCGVHLHIPFIHERIGQLLQHPRRKRENLEQTRLLHVSVSSSFRRKNPKLCCISKGCTSRQALPQTQKDNESRERRHKRKDGRSATSCQPDLQHEGNLFLFQSKGGFHRQIDDFILS